LFRFGKGHLKKIDTEVTGRMRDAGDKTDKARGKGRSPRSDARRNTDALLQAAVAVFGTSGVDAPVREIAARAGVGVGTFYRHFPQRSDLIVAVFRREIDMCADAAAGLAARYAPGEALSKWMHRYLEFIATKRGLGAALHSGDPAYAPLPAYFEARLRPALAGLLDAAAAAGDIRRGADADELLNAVAGLGGFSRDKSMASARRMVDLLIDGLRYQPDQPGGRTPRTSR
jgi:AcrR family transcriptional regulator